MNGTGNSSYYQPYQQYQPYTGVPNYTGTYTWTQWPTEADFRRWLREELKALLQEPTTIKVTLARERARDFNSAVKRDARGRFTS